MAKTKQIARLHSRDKSPVRSNSAPVNPQASTEEPKDLSVEVQVQPNQAEQPSKKLIPPPAPFDESSSSSSFGSDDCEEGSCYDSDDDDQKVYIVTKIVDTGDGLKQRKQRVFRRLDPAQALARQWLVDCFGEDWFNSYHMPALGEHSGPARCRMLESTFTVYISWSERTLWSY